MANQYFSLLTVGYTHRWVNIPSQQRQRQRATARVSVLVYGRSPNGRQGSYVRTDRQYSPYYSTVHTLRQRSDPFISAAYLFAKKSKIGSRKTGRRI